MTGLFIFLDTDKFPLPEQNNIILDTFFALKKEITKSIKPLQEKIFSGPCFIIVVIKLNKLYYDYIINDDKLKEEVISCLAKNMDLSKIAEEIKSKMLN